MWEWDLKKSRTSFRVIKNLGELHIFLDVNDYGSNQARGNAMGTSVFHGATVTNENLLHVASTSLSSNMRQPVQPSQSFSPMSCQLTSMLLMIKTLELVVQLIPVLSIINQNHLDNGVLMNSLFDGDKLQQGLVPAMDGTKMHMLLMLSVTSTQCRLKALTIILPPMR
uniref:Uncharacterized protein n=1 Tax=Oryza punctata TaxID=4537 RepID=A0A0E0L267_ORYPU